MTTRRLLAVSIVVVGVAFVLSPGVPSGAPEPRLVLDAALRNQVLPPLEGDARVELLANGERISVDAIRRWPSRSLRPQMARLVASNYTPLIEGRDRVDGRSAWVLRLKPQSKHRPWKQLWVDCLTGDVLAMRSWDSSNRLKASIRVMPGRLRDDASVVDNRVQRTGDFPILDDLPEGAPRPSYVPSGYRLIGARCPGGSAERQIVYSDGLHSISVFTGFPDGLDREQHQGNRVHDCGQVLVHTARTPRGNVAIVADLPASELLKIARSVR